MKFNFFDDNFQTVKIGIVISRARRAAGLKQKELADAAGVHVQTLKRLEGGAGAGYETVKALEKALKRAGARWEETDTGYRMTVDLAGKD
ncbi:MAG: helix-turn-helix transcriptional regulator [Pseudomonadota bacterium]